VCLRLCFMLCVWVVRVWCLLILLRMFRKLSLILYILMRLICLGGNCYEWFICGSCGKLCM